jgi:hypothetical protein
VRITAITLLLLAGIALIATEGIAASITYSIVPYPTITNPYTVTGTITTNGATGTNLPGADITSWDITITSPTTSITMTPTNSINNPPNLFDATTTELSHHRLEAGGFNSRLKARLLWED